jgi:hypothetical protein
MTDAEFGVSRDPNKVVDEPPRRPRGSKTATFGALGMGAAGIVALATAPWWIAAAILAGSVLCALVGMVFPQDSADRLEWWLDRRRNRRRRRPGHSPARPRRW